MNELYYYLFHYNSFTGYWNAFKREDKEKYFNGQLKEDLVLKNKDIMVLINYLRSTKSGNSK